MKCVCPSSSASMLDALTHRRRPRFVTSFGRRGRAFLWFTCTIAHFLSSCHCYSGVCEQRGEGEKATVAKNERKKGGGSDREARNGPKKKPRVAASGGKNIEGASQREGKQARRPRSGRKQARRQAD